MEWSHPHIQVPPLVAQPLEASSCIQRMATPHVFNIAVESSEEVENNKGLILKKYGTKVFNRNKKISC